MHCKASTMTAITLGERGTEFEWQQSNRVTIIGDKF